MNLQQAIESGEKFKRPGYRNFLEINDKGIIEWEHLEGPVTMHKDAFLADDWELESEYVLVSAKSLEETVSEFCPEVTKAKTKKIIKKLGAKNDTRSAN